MNILYSVEWYWKMIIPRGYIRIWDKALVAYLIVHSRRWPGQNDEPHEKPFRIVPAEISTRYRPDINTGLTTTQTWSVSETNVLFHGKGCFSSFRKYLTKEETRVRTYYTDTGNLLLRIQVVIDRPECRPCILTCMKITLTIQLSATEGMHLTDLKTRPKKRWRMTSCRITLFYSLPSGQLHGIGT
jgi:hypothetical protein